MSLKIYSWNVNGIRACFKNGFMPWLESSGADIVALQEVRADLSQIPTELASKNGLHQYYFSASSKKGYSGVGILSKSPALETRQGIGIKDFDQEGRVLTAFFEKAIVVSAYFPNSQDKGARIAFKLSFCEALAQFLEEYKEYFKSYDEIWYEKFDELKEFIDENKKRPYEKLKNNEEKQLGKWVSTQTQNYKNKKESMKDEIKYN